MSDPESIAPGQEPPEIVTIPPRTGYEEEQRAAGAEEDVEDDLIGDLPFDDED